MASCARPLVAYAQAHADPLAPSGVGAAAVGAFTELSTDVHGLVSADEIAVVETAVCQPIEPGVSRRRSSTQRLEHQHGGRSRRSCTTGCGLRRGARAQAMGWRCSRADTSLGVQGSAMECTHRGSSAAPSWQLLALAWRARVAHVASSQWGGAWREFLPPPKKCTDIFWGFF
jgi:hypothetical protein